MLDGFSRTPENISTTCVMLVDADLGLGEQCSSDDVCADPAAQCRGGTCQCRDNYFIADNNRCGES